MLIISLNAFRVKYDIYNIKDISSFQTSTSLMNLTTTPLCNISDIPPDGIKNKAVVVQWGTCHFLEKAKIAQTGGAEALLVANNGVLFPPSGNKSEYLDVKILIAFIDHRDFKDMKQTLGDNIIVRMYCPSWPNSDYTMVVIFVTAVFTVALGGYWSGLIELENMKAMTNTEDREVRKKKEEYFTFSPLIVIIFVVICCIMMVLLYFFYKWLGKKSFYICYFLAYNLFIYFARFIFSFKAFNWKT